MWSPPVSGGAPGEGAIWIGGGGVRSSVGEGATTLGPGVWLGAGGGNWNWGAGSVCVWADTASATLPRVAAASADDSTGTLLTAAGPHAVTTATTIPSANR